MLRFILVALTVVLFLILSIPLLLILRVVDHYDTKRRQRISLKVIRGVFRLILKIAGVRITVEGRENIPQGQAVMYVGNHRGYFDILTGYVTVPDLMGFVAKKEMLRYPLLRTWMKYVNCLFLDRKNIKEGLKTILAAIAQIKEGVSVWIFPEGTRNENGLLELLEFHEGSMKKKEKSGCPIVPVAIKGTAEIFEEHIPFIRPGRVVIRYGEPFYIKELEPSKRKFSGAYTRERIISMLREMEAES